MNEWHQLIGQLNPPHNIWFEPTELSITSDGKTALIIVESDLALKFLNQFYFLTMIYPLIRNSHPTIQHVRVVQGTIYDLVKREHAAIISFL